jgi:phospholipid/cholesterol/gamma-HCH transport system substrate-binding protein
VLSLNKYRHGKQHHKKIRLGLFIIVGLLIFILATYLIGDKQNMFGKQVI